VAVQHRGSQWTPEEDRRLLDLIKAGKSWVFISANLKRTSEIYSNPPKAAEGEGEVLTITPAGNSGTIRVSNGGGS